MAKIDACNVGKTNVQDAQSLACIFCLGRHGVLHPSCCLCVNGYYHLDCVQAWCAPREGCGRKLISDSGYVLCTICKTEQTNFRIKGKFTELPWCRNVAETLKPTVSCFVGSIVGGFVTEIAFRTPFMLYLALRDETVMPSYTLHPNFIYGQYSGCHHDFTSFRLPFSYLASSAPSLPLSPALSTAYTHTMVGFSRSHQVVSSSIFASQAS